MSVLASVLANVLASVLASVLVSVLTSILENDNARKKHIGWDLNPDLLHR